VECEDDEARRALELLLLLLMLAARRAVLSVTSYFRPVMFDLLLA